MPHAMRPLDLGAALAQHLGRVGVLPQVVDVAGEAALARQQRRGVGDRAPAVRVVLAVEREVHADVVAVVAASPRGGPTGAGTISDGARGHAVAQRGVHAVVGRVARAEVVARDDEQLGVGGVAEAFGERASVTRSSGRTLSACSPPTDRGRPAAAARAAATNSSTWATFGGMVSSVA